MAFNGLSMGFVLDFDIQANIENLYRIINLFLNDPVSRALPPPQRENLSNVMEQMDFLRNDYPRVRANVESRLSTKALYIREFLVIKSFAMNIIGEYVTNGNDY